MNSFDPLTFFAKTNFRNQHKVFGIRQSDRLAHTYIIGKTSTGKTTLLETKIMQDIHAGRGVTLIDPHGDLVERIHSLIPENRKSDLIYLDATDLKAKWGYNPIKHVSKDKRPLVASGILEVFKKLFSDAWGVKMEHILRNVLLTLLDQKNATLKDIPRLLGSKSFRNEAIQNITNPEVAKFWKYEYANYPWMFRANTIAPIQNKVGAFLSNPITKKILTEAEEEIAFRKIMDEGKILLINLSKGIIGEDASHLLGGVFLTSLGLAAFSRSELSEETRALYMVYVDEFQNFTTLSLVNMLSELRKYKVGMVLANQYLDQLDKDIREAVLGNVGTLISFRLGAKDARYMAREFYPVFSQEDIISLPNYHIYLKLMIDGTPSKPFSAITVRNCDMPKPQPKGDN